MNRMTPLDIERILAHFDVEQLIAAGAPQNEYAAEASELANEILAGASYQHIEQAVTDLFHKNFDFAYVLPDEPDGLAFTKHYITKIDFSADLAGLDLMLKNQSDSKLERASRVRGAAYAIFQLLRHGQQKAHEVIVRMSYQAPTERVEAQACLFLTDGIADAVVRKVTVPALDKNGIERGKLTLQFDAEGKLLAIEIDGAITALPRDLLNKVWSGMSSIELDPETLRNS